jgi:ligand-binding sensor domain-containing protein/two-component sensor histidine kinase
MLSFLEHSNLPISNHSTIFRGILFPRQIYTYRSVRFTLFWLFLLAVQPHIVLGDTPLLISQPEFSRNIDQPTISKIFRDHNNLLWIGTQQGLFRYDGAFLTHFGSNKDNENHISHSDIRGISVDRSGNLILATFGGGLFIWNSDSQKFQKPRNITGFKLAQIDYLSITNDGVVWVASKGSLIALDERMTRVLFSTEDLSPTINLRQINGIETIGEGVYLTASNSGLWKIDLLNQFGITKINLRNNPRVLALESFENDTIYMALSDGHITKLDPDTLEIQLDIPTLEENVSTVSDISLTDEFIWVATDRGIYLLNHKFETIKVLDSGNTGLSDNYVTSLHFDNDIYWIGTIHGLNILSRNHMEVFNHRQSAIHHEVLAFTSGADSNIWIGTYDGLFKKHPEEDFHLKLETTEGENLKDQRIMTLATKGDELWIGFRSRGIQVLNTVTNELSSPVGTELDQAEVTKILVTSDGTVWIATYNQGLYRFHDGDLLHISSINNPSITILLETSSGEVIAASENSFYISEGRGSSFREVALEYPQTAQEPLLLSIAEHESGRLYLGTKDQGTFVWQDFSTGSTSAQLAIFGTDPAVRSATIYGILLDDEGKLWASTQKGIMVLNPDQSLRFRLLKQDGLQDNDFNFGAAFKDANGAMYFGGVRGYNKLDPPKLIVDYSPPKLHLVSIETPDAKHYVAGRGGVDLLELNHSDYFVTFSFSTLDFTSTGAAQYRYKLEGFDPQWIDNGKRNTATYTNLPPGDYTLKVEGTNAAGVWSQGGIVLQLRVLPPYWLSSWAFAVYAILFLLIAWGLKRAYDNHVIKEHAIKYAAEMVATADRMEDDLQEQHEVQDELTKASHRHNLALLELIREDFDRGQPKAESVSKHIKVLTLLEGCYCYQTDALQADLHRFTNLLVSQLAKHASVEVETITTVNSVSSQLIPAGTASPLALVMFELLENAFQHAFTDLSRPINFIEISLDISDPIGQESPHYSLSVTDDGQGTVADTLPDPDKPTGLGFVHHIAKQYGGSVDISHDSGTRVTFTVGNCSTG